VNGLLYLLYIVVAIALFGVLIAVHEFGHFCTAKLLGVKVNEFAIGMGPRLWHRQRGETQYSLRLLPIGGFCAMEGEDEATDDPRSFACQPFWKKLIILVAGSFMNFVAGVVIILILFSQAAAFVTPVVSGFMEGADHLVEQGLQEGDLIYRVDGHRIYLMNDASLFLSRAGDTVDLEVVRAGEHIVFENFDFARKVPSTDDQGQTTYLRGIYYGGVEEATLGVKLRNTWYQSIDCVRLVWMSLGDLIRGAAGLRDLSGPIGIVDAVGTAGASAASVGDGLYNVFSFMSLIAINLAVMNLLPIPALDGGRIFFLIVGGVFRLLTRKNLDPKYESWVNMAGFVLLMGLMVVVAVSDVMKLAGV
jgi:regulator of sigma E protease